MNQYQNRPAREAVMTALFTALVNSIKTPFTADTAVGSNVLANPSTTTGLFLGLPVFGPGIPGNTVIATLTPTLTLSQKATIAATAAVLTTGFLTFSRRFKHWSQVPNQPALFLRDAEEDVQYPQTSMQELRIMAELYLYTNAGQNPDAVPASALNNILDAIQTVMRPDRPMENRFTLGGLVHWCRIVGKVLKESGDAAGQAIAVADVEIIVP